MVADVANDRPAGVMQEADNTIAAPFDLDLDFDANAERMRGLNDKFLAAAKQGGAGVARHL
jgi:hypothetical protein